MPSYLSLSLKPIYATSQIGCWTAFLHSLLIFWNVDDKNGNFGFGRLFYSLISCLFAFVVKCDAWLTMRKKSLTGVILVAEEQLKNVSDKKMAICKIELFQKFIMIRYFFMNKITLWAYDYIFVILKSWRESSLSEDGIFLSYITHTGDGCYFGTQVILGTWQLLFTF